MWRELKQKKAGWAANIKQGKERGEGYITNSSGRRSRFRWAIHFWMRKLRVSVWAGRGTEETRQKKWQKCECSLKNMMKREEIDGTRASCGRRECGAAQES